MYVPAREIHRHHAVISTRVVEDAGRVAKRTVVAGHRIEDQHLHAGVAGIHLLLEIRTVHEHLVQAVLHAAHTDALDIRNRRIVAGEAHLRLQRIARLGDRKARERQRRVAGLHGDLHPAARSPPRRREPGLAASVAKERIVHRTVYALAGEFVAASLVQVYVSLVRDAVEALGPRPAYSGGLPACGLQYRECAIVILEIPEDPQPRMRRNHQRPGILQQRVRVRDGGVRRIGRGVQAIRVGNPRLHGADASARAHLLHGVWAFRGEQRPTRRMETVFRSPDWMPHDIHLAPCVCGWDRIEEPGADGDRLRASHRIRVGDASVADRLDLRRKPIRLAGREP